uniref:Major facilitator superfamily (MFS) profile domain-containing protein n=1 Tax=Glossina austeni TaxID=7395 RepID=A0A1A9URD9_GLOAU
MKSILPCSNFGGSDEHYFIKLPRPKLLIFDDESSEEETPTSTTPAAIPTNIRISESAPALLNLTVIERSERTQGTSSQSDDGEKRRSQLSKNLDDLKSGNAFIYLVIPPDGGYGWLIMFVSFLSQVVVDGIIFAGGIMLPYIANDFNETGSKVILIISLQVGGPSLSMIWVSSQLIVGYYFEKYRPIANGISCSGAGAGVALFAYLNSILLPEIGWRNTIRVHTCFLVAVFILDIAYVEVTPSRIGVVKDPYFSESDSSESLDDELEPFSTVTYRKESNIVSIDQDLEEMLETYQPVSSRKKETIFTKCCPLLSRHLKKKKEETQHPQSLVLKPNPLERKDIFYTGPAEYAGLEKSVSRKISIMKERKSLYVTLETTRKTARSIVNTLSNLDRASRYGDKRRTYAQLKTTHKFPLLAFLSPKNWLNSKIKRAFSLLFDFRLLQMRQFNLLLASAFLFPMGFNIPFVYSTGRVQIDLEYARLITPTIGLSNFVFRILSGCVAFKFREYTTVICGGGMAFGGVAVLVSAFYGINVVWFQFVYATCYGIAPACYSTLRAIIYVRTVGLEKLTNAFGLTALAMGLGVCLGTTAGGVMLEMTGSYTVPFAFAGICIIISGVLKTKDLKLTLPELE